MIWTHFSFSSKLAIIASHTCWRPVPYEKLKLPFFPLSFSLQFSHLYALQKKDLQQERERKRFVDLFDARIHANDEQKRKPEFCNNNNKTPKETKKGKAKGTWNRYEKEEQ